MQTAMIQRFCYELTETPILGLGLEITFTFNFHPPFPVANAILIWSHLKTRIGAGDNTSYVLVMDQHIGQLGLNESKSNKMKQKKSHKIKQNQQKSSNIKQKQSQTESNKIG